MFPVCPQATTFRKLFPPWSYLIVYNRYPGHLWELLGNTLSVTGTSEVLSSLTSDTLTRPSRKAQSAALLVHT